MVGSYLFGFFYLNKSKTMGIGFCVAE